MADNASESSGDGYVDPVVYFQNLPTLSAAAGFYITDATDRVLLVKPNYRDHWAIPGGVVEHNEPPGQAAVREVREELGLILTDHRLLVVSWLAAHERIPRPMIRFIFDGGHIDDTPGLRLAADELHECALFPMRQAVGRLHRAAAYTLPVAAQARTDRVPRFLSHAEPPEPLLD